MINKQRVQRIRAIIYTCILLLFFFPIILMIVVSFQTRDLLKHLIKVLEEAPPAVVMQAPEQDEGLPDSSDLQPQGQSADNNSSLADMVNEDEKATEGPKESTPGELGGYVENTYLPDSYPQLYFDTVPVPSTPKADTLYLTFDNTPSTYYSSILEVLDKHDVKATFFVWWNESLDRSNATFYKQLIENGHQIGIHSFSSDKTFSQLYASAESFLEDFDRIFGTIYEETGVKPRIYRLPGGSVSPQNPSRQQVLNEVKVELDSRGFLQHDWTASAQDAVSPSLSKDQVLRNIQNSMSDSGQVVILAHDGTGSRSTVEALDEFISQYKAQGYSFGVLDNDIEPVSFLQQRG